MKLLFTSNGLSNAELEQAFSELTAGRSTLKVALIPTAGDPIEWIPVAKGSKECVARPNGTHDVVNGSDYRSLVNKGYEVVIADLKEDPAKLREKLEHIDAIFVGGGDVNYLLDWAKKSGLPAYIQGLLDRDVVYVGISAGCGLLSPDIGLTWWEPGNPLGLDHVGFGIVDFNVVVHQRESDEHKSQKRLLERLEYVRTHMEYPWRTYLVQDGQAIRVDGDAVTHIGPGPKRCLS